MAENIQVLRIEVSDSSVSNVRSSGQSTSALSPGSLIATAAVKGVGRSTAGRMSISEQYDYLKDWVAFGDDLGSDFAADIVEEVKQDIGEPGTGFVSGITQGFRQRRIRREKLKLSRNLYLTDRQGNPDPYYSRYGEIALATSKQSFKNAGTTAWNATVKYGPKIASGALAFSALQSQNKVIGYNLSGAIHASEIQQRRQQATTFATGLGISLATGQYWATGLMLAGRAWQLAQQNRQEIFQIRASQIIAEVKNQRVINDTAKRRF